MSLGTRMYHILISTFAVLVLTSCGGAKSKSQLAEITVSPEKPIVITADATLANDEKVTGPWFQFTMRMTNGSAEPITIVAVTAEVYSTTGAGAADKKEVAFTPGEFNRTISETVECQYSSFGTWAPGETKALSLASATEACRGTPMFIIGSNKKPVNGTTYRYRVKAKPVGWFGSLTDATDRFDRSVLFFTQ